jgi:hypothetical protein
VKIKKMFTFPRFESCGLKYEFGKALNNILHHPIGNEAEMFWQRRSIERGL